MSSPDEWLALVRWRNAALAAAGVCAAAWWSAGRLTSRVALVATCAIALTAVANTTNDLADVEIDRVAHPGRPLPSGAISPVAARRLAIACTLVAITLTILVDVRLALLTIVVVAIMWVYSTRLKRHGMPGNITVAILGSLPFLYGAWAVGETEKGVLLTAVASPLHFAREVAKDLDDAAADERSRRTLPVTRGTDQARRAVVAGVVAYAAAVAMLVSAFPLFSLMLVPSIVVAAVAVRRSYRGRSGATALFKLAMVFGVIALVVSAR